MEFLKPTKIYKELKLLEYIESRPRAPLHEIAKVTRGASSMVAVYIDKLEGQGYLVKDYQSHNIIHYKITTEGIKRKDQLQREYYNELLDIYHLEKDNIKIHLKGFEEEV